MKYLLIYCILFLACVKIGFVPNKVFNNLTIGCLNPYCLYGFLNAVLLGL